MAFPDDIFLNGDRCEICGIGLEDEIVIQEFADGSLARLCPECAAGAALEALETYEPSLEDTAEHALDEEPEVSEEAPFSFPEPEAPVPAEEEQRESEPAFVWAAAATAAALSAEPAAPDRLEKTRELLTPVVDLITLQREMQGALQRLASSLEVFAAGVITENLDKAATVESRLESLERELEHTRARLRETEALLAVANASGAASASSAAITTAPVIPEFAVPVVAATVPEFITPEPRPSLVPVGGEPIQERAGLPEWIDEAQPLEDTKETAEAAALLSTSGEEIDAGQAVAAALGAAAAAAGAAPIPVPVTPPTSAPVPPPAADQPAHEYHAFELGEVQSAQRYYNDSAFTQRIRDVRRSLGKPKANLTKLPGSTPRALLTIAWDIIWYQYLIDLRRDVPSDTRIVLYREGMDLDELAGLFKEKNASIDDEGRLDASELEVKLLSDPTVLITEMTPEEERALEDATEEIWDQRAAPEFKWDD